MRSGPLFLGIDTGLTTTKAVVFDERGTALGSASTPSPRSEPASQRVERDAIEHWEVTAGVIGRAIDVSGRDAAEIAGVGLAGHGDGLYFVGEDLAPLAPAVLSPDTRAAAILAGWHDTDRFDRALALGGTVPFAGAPAPLLAWYAEHDPQLLGRTRWLLTAKDWLRARITGEVATDPTDAFSSFTDLVSHRYLSGLADLYDAGGALEQLPPILASAKVAGAVTSPAAGLTGLPPGTPVVTGLHDVAACLLAVAGNRLRHAVLIAGTFGINIVQTDQPVRSRLLTCRPAPDPGRWTVRRSSPASGANVEWAVSRLALDAKASDSRTMVGESVDAALAAVARPDAPIYLPYLFGGPPGRPGTAALVGLRPWHTPTDLLRGVVYGLTFNHRADVGELRREVAVDALYLTGGAAANPRWTQLFADVLGTPVTVPAVRETGALGAAMCAAVGTGHFADLDTAFAAMGGGHRIVEPRPGPRTAIEDAYETYLRTLGTFTG